MAFMEHGLSLCFLGWEEVSQPAGELSWRDLFGERVSPPGVPGLQPLGVGKQRS